MRKLLTITLLFILSAFQSFAQDSFSKEVAKFDKIIVSPHINLVLTEDNSDQVSIEYSGLDPDKINIEVNGSTLHLYLDDARIIPKTEKDDYNYHRDIYQGAEITAYVSVSYLSALEVRGDQQVISKAPIDVVSFKLKAYGAATIDLASLDAENLKVVSYGESEIRIRSGKVNQQKYALYGSSHVEASKMSSEFTKAKVYGESELVLLVNDELNISAFGEPIITYYGNPMVNKNIIIGEPKFFKVN